MAFSKLSIEYRIDQHSRPQISLNGQAVPGLRGLTVEMGIDSATTATFEVMLEELDIDAETLIHLHALLSRTPPHDAPATVVAPLPGDE